MISGARDLQPEKVAGRAVDGFHDLDDYLHGVRPRVFTLWLLFRVCQVPLSLNFSWLNFRNCFCNPR